MSALGHYRTSPRHFRMSALPPKADIAERHRHVRFVPKADIHALRVSYSPTGRLSSEVLARA
jgi:hypothetical protein